MPVLAICVPIWNSIREVDRTISTLMDLAALSADLVEIAISDNCSDDGTWEKLLNAGLHVRPNVKLVQQKRNIGFRGNMLALAKSTRSEFIWFLGAGEKIDTASVGPIIEHLKTTTPSTLVLRGKLESVQAAQESYDSEATIDFKLLESGFPCSETISMNIFKSQEVSSCLESPKAPGVMQDSWPHLEIASESWSNGPVYFQTGRPVVEISVNPHGWWFHGPGAFAIYADKLLLGGRNPRIRESKEYSKLAGIQAALHVFEVRVKGQEQTIEAWARFYKLVSPTWRPLVFAAYCTPKSILLIVQRMKRLLAQIKRPASGQ